MTKEINDFILALTGSQELVDTWWNSHNLFFGSTPAAEYEIRPSRVRAYLLDQLY